MQYFFEFLGLMAVFSIFIVVPGADFAVILRQSIVHGRRAAMMTGLGMGFSLLFHISYTILGLGLIVSKSLMLFAMIKWAGVAYLVYLGIATWRAPVADLAQTQPQARSGRLIFARGFLVGLTNPKTLLFYGAFFPQFITPGPDAGQQLLLLAVTFLAVAIVCDSLWAILAGRLRALLVVHTRLRNRITGGLLVGAGLGLAMARRQ